VSPPSVAVHRFGGFLLDGNAGGVFRFDEQGNRVRLALGSRALDPLHYLVDRCGEVATKQAIMAAVWPDTCVEENNLTVHISALRRALDRGSTDGSCIQTVPGRGYRFVVPVAREEVPASPHPHAAFSHRAPNPKSLEFATPSAQAALARPDRPSIAVLAFTNMSADPGQEYFSDGVSDDITGQLARNTSLFVIARSSSFSYKNRCVGVRQIANELAVRYILEGSVQRDGVRVRIGVRLVEAETEAYLWASRYDRDLASLFAMHDEIAHAVVTEVTSAIARAETGRALRKPPATLSSWEAYQRGLWHMWKQSSHDDLASAGAFFHQAVALDPFFADAHAMLARYYAAEDPGGPERTNENRLAQAESEVRMALRLDPSNAAAHATLALILSNRYGVAWQQPLQHAEQAIDLNVNNASGYFVKGHILVFQHRTAEARLALDTARQLDPMGRIAVGVAHHLAVAAYLERDYLSAVAAAQRIIREHPHWPRIHPYLVASLSHMNRDNEARRALHDAISIAPKFFDFRARQRPAFCHPEDHEHMLEGLRKAGWQG
jgi:adenylate cyclase